MRKRVEIIQVFEVETNTFPSHTDVALSLGQCKIRMEQAGLGRCIHLSIKNIKEDE